MQVKTKIIILIIAAVIVFGGLIAFIFFASENIDGIQDSAYVGTACEEVDAQYYEGRASLKEWYEDYQGNIDDYSGRTLSVMDEIGAYVTEEQEEELNGLEQAILNAGTIKEQESYIKKFNKLVEELTAYKEEVEYTAYVNSQPVQQTVSYEASESNYSSGSSDSSSFKSQGVVYQDGTRYTWYSQNVLPGNGLNIPGRHVGDDDLIYDSDGYIAVASSDHAHGTVVDTPFGQGKVYDDGCDSGTIDIYTNY